METNKFYVTAAIPYVNAAPHLGHALEFVQSDVIARYHRLRKEEVFFLTGADENALKNVQAAEKAGMPVSELVDKNTALFRALIERLSIGIDGFQRGSDKELHWLGVGELWGRVQKSGDIYKKSYRGLYCVGCEEFKTEKDLTTDGLCPEHLVKPEIVEEENYFFRLSKYQQTLEELIASDTYAVIPSTRKNETLAFIRQGLEDFSVSRSVERARGWGVPVPDDPTQVIYVWFDALAIYLTGVGFGVNQEKFVKWWPADLHIVGKGIMRFHSVFWPAMLLSAGLPLPKVLLVHGYITSEGQKMSKTIGNVVEPLTVAHEFGVDVLRYYLLSEIPTLADGDFSREKFIARYNGDLANGLGNLVSRITTLAQGITFSEEFSPKNISEAEQFKSVWQRWGEAFSQYDLRGAVGSVWDLIHWLDELIERKRPWESKDPQTIYVLCVGLANIAWLLRPFMPQTAEKIENALGIEGREEWKFEVKRIDPLFPKHEAD